MNNVTGNYSGLTEKYGYDDHIKLLDTGEELKGGILTVRHLDIIIKALYSWLKRKNIRADMSYY